MIYESTRTFDNDGKIDTDLFGKIALVRLIESKMRKKNAINEINGTRNNCYMLKRGYSMEHPQSKQPQEQRHHNQQQ